MLSCLDLRRVKCTLIIAYPPLQINWLNRDNNWLFLRVLLVVFHFLEEVFDSLNVFVIERLFMLSKQLSDTLDLDIFSSLVVENLRGFAGSRLLVLLLILFDHPVRHLWVWLLTRRILNPALRSSSWLRLRSFPGLGHKSLLGLNLLDLHLVLASFQLFCSAQTTAQRVNTFSVVSVSRWMVDSERTVLATAALQFDLTSAAAELSMARFAEVVCTEAVE